MEDVRKMKSRCILLGCRCTGKLDDERFALKHEAVGLGESLLGLLDSWQRDKRLPFHSAFGHQSYVEPGEMQRYILTLNALTNEGLHVALLFGLPINVTAENELEILILDGFRDVFYVQPRIRYSR